MEKNPIDKIYRKHHTRAFLQKHIFLLQLFHFGRLYFHDRSYLIKTSSIKFYLINCKQIMLLFLFLIMCTFEHEGNNPLDNFYLKYHTREFLQNHIFLLQLFILVVCTFIIDHA